MTLKICKNCNKEKRLSDFYRRNTYIYASCIECNNYRRKTKIEVEIRRKNEQKKILLENNNLKGSNKLYYDYFCEKIKYSDHMDIRVSERHALQDLKRRFKLNHKFVRHLAENQFKGKGVLEIDYEKNYIRSKI